MDSIYHNKLAQYIFQPASFRIHFFSEQIFALLQCFINNPSSSIKIPPQISIFSKFEPNLYVLVRFFISYFPSINYTQNFYFDTISMNKLNDRLKLPPFRNKSQKRQSNAQITSSSTKPEFGHEVTNQDQILMLTKQGDIAKRIQSKLRLRKVGSMKRSSLQQSEKTAVLRLFIDQEELDFEAKMDQLWENSAEISELLNKHSTVVPCKLKARVMKEAGMIRCQSVSVDLEQLMVGRVKRLCQLIISQQRCSEQENLLSRLLDQRMRKLADSLRTR